jgi:hypothetical protein
MLPVAIVDCAPAGSRLKVVKQIHRIKANQNLGLLILFLLSVRAQSMGPGIINGAGSTANHQTG